MSSDMSLVELSENGADLEGAKQAAETGNEASDETPLRSGEGRVHRSVLADGWHEYFRRSFRAVLIGSKMNSLMVLMPLALVGAAKGWTDGICFVFALLAICPFAERLGYVTEQLAMHTNDTLGGLLNATFGNATELIISIFAMKAELYRVVQLSLLGSVLSNMLLVLGCAFFVGGLKHREQTFNKISGLVNSGALMLGVMGVLFPAVLHMSNAESAEGELELSRFVSVMLLIVYVAYLVFQLKTHRDMFEGQEDDDEDEQPVLGFWGSIAWLGVLTIFISVLSDVLVDTIKGAAEENNISSVFIAAIVIPIVGNAAEHAAAVIFAYRNKMDIAIGVAVGSSTQIALLVIPFCVIMSWCMGKDLSLYFQAYETATMFATVISVTFLISDGRSNWLTGLMLMIAYFIISAGFWVHTDEDLSE